MGNCIFSESMNLEKIYLSAKKVQLISFLPVYNLNVYFENNNILAYSPF